MTLEAPPPLPNPNPLVPVLDLNDQASMLALKYLLVAYTFAKAHEGSRELSAAKDIYNHLSSSWTSTESFLWTQSFGKDPQFAASYKGLFQPTARSVCALALAADQWFASDHPPKVNYAPLTDAERQAIFDVIHPWVTSSCKSGQIAGAVVPTDDVVLPKKEEPTPPAPIVTRPQTSYWPWLLVAGVGGGLFWLAASGAGGTKKGKKK